MHHFVFRTRFGWCGIVGSKGVISKIILPCKDKGRILERIKKDYPETIGNACGLTRASRSIRDYFEGRVKRFNLVIDLTGFSGFEKKVYQSLRKIPYGRLTTYNGLAKRIGFPRAARAVGNAMAKNRLPLIVPCHRVVRNDGSIGNFSALGGTALKRQLLELEARNK